MVSGVEGLWKARVVWLLLVATLSSGAVSAQLADLTVSLSNDVDGVVEWSAAPFHWFIEVTNVGDAPATWGAGQWILTDYYPFEQVHIIEHDIVSQSGVSGSFNCSFSIRPSQMLIYVSCRALASSVVTLDGNGGTFTLRLTVAPQRDGLIINPPDGQICAVDPHDNVVESDETNNSCSDSVLVTPSPDLTVSKSNNVSGLATVGEPFWWQIEVTNSGTADFILESGLTLLRDELPDSDITYSDVSAFWYGMDGSAACSLDIESNLLCTATEDVVLRPGDRFVARVEATPLGVGSFTNPRTAGVCRANPDSSVPEGLETNNDCWNGLVAERPELSVVKSDSVSGSMELGAGDFQWTLRVENTGEASAFWRVGDVIVRDQLTVDQISHTELVSSWQQIACIFDCVEDELKNCISIVEFACYAYQDVELGSGDSFVIEVTAVPEAAGTFSNPRSGGICAVDPDNSIVEDDETNNACSHSVVVTPSPDLIVTKTNDVLGTAEQGTEFTWSLKIQNVGAGAAQFEAGAQLIRDALPRDGMVYGQPVFSALIDGTGDVSCEVDATDLTCAALTAVSLSSGGEFTVEVPATPTGHGNFSNPARGRDMPG